MATPHVTGAAALYASTHPLATAFEIRNALLGSTLPTPSLANTITGGRLDLSTIIGRIDAPPAPPGLAATAGNAQVTLTWNITTAAGSYTVKRGTSSGVYDSIVPGLTATKYIDSNLVNGTTYYYAVSATNSEGEGPAAQVSAIPRVPVTPPAAPTNLVAKAVSASQINLTWADNSDNEDGFKIEQSTNNRSFTQIATVGPNVSSYPISGLSRNNAYYYRVRSYNVVGNSAYATASTKTLR
jgi:fibronectin type 3 domain-containing protein